GLVPPVLVTGPCCNTNAEAPCTVKKTGLETPPPGAGLTTVTVAVVATVKSVERIWASNWVELTKVVVRAWPFHCTTDPFTNPVPRTLRFEVGVPGAAASGLVG